MGDADTVPPPPPSDPGPSTSGFIGEWTTKKYQLSKRWCALGLYCCTGFTIPWVLVIWNLKFAWYGLRSVPPSKLIACQVLMNGFTFVCVGGGVVTAWVILVSSVQRVFVFGCRYFFKNHKSLYYQPGGETVEIETLFPVGALGTNNTPARFENGLRSHRTGCTQQRIWVKCNKNPMKIVCWAWDAARVIVSSRAPARQFALNAMASVYSLGAERYWIALRPRFILSASKLYQIVRWK